MTELKMIVECSLGHKVEQTLTNEKDFHNIEIQRYVKSIKMYYDGQEIRNVNKD
jgi:hypothetical protein